MAMLKAAYLDTPDIQTATFHLLHELFAEWGLIVLIADKAPFKRQMISIFEDDLFRGEPTRIVNDTVARLGKQYKIQANPRPINLFYLKGVLPSCFDRTKEGLAGVY